MSFERASVATLIGREVSSPLMKVGMLRIEIIGNV